MALQVLHDREICARTDADDLGAQPFDTPDLSLLIAADRRGQHEAQAVPWLIAFRNGLESHARSKPELGAIVAS